MGQKVHPLGMRLGIIRGWDSTWYAEGNFASYLESDIRVREFLKKKLAAAGVSRVTISRLANSAQIKVYASRPGVIIGKRGSDIDELRTEVRAMIGVPVHIDIEEVRKPETNAMLVAANIAQQLERRVMFRRAMKRAVQNAIRAGAEGVKVNVGGRLGGAEIARSEWYREGRVPLHTLRADIEYGTAEAKTTYGIIGVKVWVFKGEILEKPAKAQPIEEEAE